MQAIPILLPSLLSWPFCCCFHSCCCLHFCCCVQSPTIAVILADASCWRHCCFLLSCCCWHSCCCWPSCNCGNVVGFLLLLSSLLLLMFLLLLISNLGCTVCIYCTMRHIELLDYRITAIRVLFFSAIGISNNGLENSRNYRTIEYRIKATVYRTIGNRTQIKLSWLPTSDWNIKIIL